MNPDRAGPVEGRSGQHPQPGGPGGLLGTRTIGDLVSGEIERTLEISNLNPVDMSVMMRPETVYSPISRPASADGDAGLATLAHVASYAPANSAGATRSSVLFTQSQQSQQR